MRAWVRLRWQARALVLAVMGGVLAWGLVLPAQAMPVSQAAIELQDARGETVRLARPAQRIVSLAPHFIANLEELGALDRLVGRLAFPDDPPSVQKLPTIGAYNSISVETILTLQPDLILAWQSGNSPQVLRQLEQLGLPLFVEEPRSLADVAQSLRNLGRLTGLSARAERRAQTFEEEIAALRQQYAERPPVTVFYQIWHQPLQTLNGQHLVSDLMLLCGGRNVFADALPLAPKVSVEAVLATRPQVIIGNAGRVGMEPDFSQWRPFSDLPAVANGQLHSIRADWLLQFTSQLRLGARKLCEILEQAR